MTYIFILAADNVSKLCAKFSCEKSLRFKPVAVAEKRLLTLSQMPEGGAFLPAGVFRL